MPDTRVCGNSATPTAFVSSYINANSAYAAGIELIFRNNLTNWWELNFNTNVYYSKINGSNVVADLENERISSFSKINNNFKLPTGFTIQLSGDYQSRSALPVSTSNSGGGGQRGGGGGGWMGGSPSTTQGYIDANYGVDFGPKRILKSERTRLHCHLILMTSSGQGGILYIRSRQLLCKMNGEEEIRRSVG